MYILFLLFLNVLGAPFNDNLPVLLFHGLGDAASSPGMYEAAQWLAKRRNVEVHRIAADNASIFADQRASVFGSVTHQLQGICKSLDGLSPTGRFDAIGFSQGGQFLRGLLQICPGIGFRNLLTFGSQHMGIDALPSCTSTMCTLARLALSRVDVYSDYAQSKLIQAQYWRDPAKLQEYYTKSRFLALVNGESSDVVDPEYIERMSNIENFVMIKFSLDTTAVPKDSAWFGSRRAVGDVSIVPLQEQEIYTKDKIGLRQLDKAGRLHFEECFGPHMMLVGCWEKYVDQYIGQTETEQRGFLSWISSLVRLINQ